MNTDTHGDGPDISVFHATYWNYKISNNIFR